MIEQYTIATTPKYNFPQTTIDTTLPKQFAELSINSLKIMQKQPIQLNHQELQHISTAEKQQIQLNSQPIQLKPKHEQTIIAAIDASSIKIGETSAGILIGVRASAVMKQNKRYNYMRFGPFIFHITEENKREVCEALQSAYFNLQSDCASMCLPNLTQISMRIASLLERWLQKNIARTLVNSIILFDGSLTSGTPDTPTRLMKEILEAARERGNIILAFSKMTNLRVNGHLITEILPPHKAPYMLETIGLKPKPPLVLLGDVFVARLTSGGYAFRLDIDKEATRECKIEAVEKLLGNDIFSQSYPETLRLAHILCTFTANEVVAMQYFITRKYKLQILNRPDIHRLLFGPFGKGDSCA